MIMGLNGIQRITLQAASHGGWKPGNRHVTLSHEFRPATSRGGFLLRARLRQGASVTCRTSGEPKTEARLLTGQRRQTRLGYCHEQVKPYEAGSARHADLEDELAAVSKALEEGLRLGLSYALLTEE